LLVNTELKPLSQLRRWPCWLTPRKIGVDPLHSPRSLYRAYFQGLGRFSIKFIRSNLPRVAHRTFVAIVLNATAAVSTLSQRRRRGLAWVDPLEESSTDHWISDRQRPYSWGTLPSTSVHQHVCDTGWSHAVLQPLLHRTDTIRTQYSDVRMPYLADVLLLGNEGKRVTLFRDGQPIESDEPALPLECE